MRLEAYRLAQAGLLEMGVLKPGSLLSAKDVRLNMRKQRDFTLPPEDAAFSKVLREQLGADAPHYGVAVLDISEPSSPRFAAVNPNKIQNPGSVGKIMVALAIFQALADIYPDDLDARRRILYYTPITANRFILRDSHNVPLWEFGWPKVEKRPIQEGDRANLWTFMDWMMSASSNAAASMLMSHLVLMVHFGEDYPVSDEKAREFFEETPKSQLSKIFLDAIRTPATRSGIDIGKLRQGSFFTRTGKTLVPGTNSVATSRELLRYMLLLEQGKLVDEFSSLEIKKLLYLTDGRIRYASSPALDGSALYFKSGSLYGCKPEKGFECGKYRGNRINYMNSVVTVETRERKKPLVYIAVVLSNVLRKDSVQEHIQLAGRIHRMIESYHPVGVSDALAAPARSTAP